MITQHDSLKRFNVRSGKVIWKEPEGYGDAALVGSVVVASGEKERELLGRDVRDRRILWRLPLRDPGTSYGVGNEVPPAISDGEIVWLLRETVVCVTRDGREKWNAKEPFTGLPTYADSERVVTIDSERILAYTAGTLPPLPDTDAEKRDLAQRLVSQFEMLDRAERGRLEKLTPFSFSPLLARYVGWAKEYDAKPEGKDSYSLYSLLQDVIPLLTTTYRRGDTGKIVAALASLGDKSSWRQELERLLQAKGDPSEYIPTLVTNLRRLPLKDREDSAALDAIAHSSHPDAVALMLEALRDPKAAPAWRRAAFQHLAGTGGAEGVQAVRATRTKRVPRKPWFDQIDFASFGKRGSLSVKTDGKGRVWMLFHSAILGNRSDLFIVQKAGARWGRPLFTGSWTERTFNTKAPKTFRGIPIAKLVATEWIRIFPNDATIRRDSDGDGLTDLVEARLGTNPKKADTDGDGLSDLIDPCPNAAPRALGDTEKIVAACMEARFFESDWGVPAILSIENVKPFEMYGYASPVLWDIPGHKIPLADLYGGGVNTIGFHSPDGEKRDAKKFIQYSPDGKTARTVIRRYSGGLDGDGIEVTLKKLGTEWFVVNLRMVYVS